MRLTLAFLLCAAVLIAAAPVCADRISSPKFAEEFLAPVNAGIPAKSTSVVVFSDRFAGWDSKPSSALCTFFYSSSDMNIHPASLSGLDSDRGPSSIGHAWQPLSKEREGEKDRGRHHSGATQVPEPGSFSLLLIALAAFGLLVRRRREPPMAV